MLRTSLQRLFAAVFVVVIFGLGVVVDSVSTKRRHAELLVRRMATLKVGASSFTEARALAEEYSGKPESEGLRSEDCSAQACTFTFVIDNRPLNHIPGVGAVQFVATIGVKDGYVVEQQINYTILYSTSVDFAYLLIDHLDSRGFEVQKLRVDSKGMPHVVKVNLGRSATAEERRLAYSIDLSCLARLRVCRDAAVFPSGL